jgi:hypothetical protein
MQELQFPCDKLTARTDPDGFVSIVQMQEMAAKLDNLFQSLKTPVKVADYKFNNVAVVFTLVYKDTEKSTKRFEAKVQKPSAKPEGFLMPKRSHTRNDQNALCDQKRPPTTLIDGSQKT